jgi:hypothetical protein
MPFLSAEKIITAFQKLSAFMAEPDAEFSSLMERSSNYNAWFTPEEVQRAVASLSNMLNNTDLEKWFQSISISESPKKVGLILAGNIPLVGFHDVISVLSTGNIALMKLSSSDDKLLPALLKQLVSFEPAFADHIQYTERLKDFDYYFGKVPNIIRKNRNSVAVLTGSESPEAIQLLGHDLFDYFGLGCRNVSKIFIPADYDIKNFFEPIEAFQPIINHFKYNNNYDYNKSIFLVNGVQHFDNGFLLLKEDSGLASPLAVLYFERYTDLADVKASLAVEKDNIQCVVSEVPLDLELPQLAFGQSQNPRLWDYADNVNTIEFLKGI